MTNVLKELVGVTGLNLVQFGEKVGTLPNHVCAKIKKGGDIKISTLKNYADANSLKVNIEISNGNSRVKLEL